jgi:hypothetical protein
VKTRPKDENSLLCLARATAAEVEAGLGVELFREAVAVLGLVDEEQALLEVEALTVAEP